MEMVENKGDLTSKLLREWRILTGVFLLVSKLNTLVLVNIEI